MDVKYFLLCCLSLSLFACEPELTDSSGVMEARFQDRINALTNNILEDCLEDVLAKATSRADSLLIDRAQRQVRIEGRPPRPPRPGAPPVKELSAPLPLRPLFPFEIRFDTLLRKEMLRDSINRDSISRGLIDTTGFFLEGL